MTPQRSVKEQKGAGSRRPADIAAIVAGYEKLMAGYPTEGAVFLDVGITMAQAKVLFLVEAVGELHMSQLVGRLGVSLSTVSGLVERLVEHGLVSRRDDPADRRQVVVGATSDGAALVDRFRQLGVGQLNELLMVLTDGELDDVRRGLEALNRAVDRVVRQRVPEAPAAQAPGAAG